jgi:YHS domain-containing protein
VKASRVAACILVLSFWAVVLHAESKAPANAGPACPISGKPIDLAAKVATDEGPVFFCCKGCPAKYEAEPAAYKANVSAQREAMASWPRVQETCPLSGKPISKDAKVEHDGQTVFFCCSGCAGKFEKEPAKYKGKLASSYTYLQPAVCPVSGKPVNFAVKPVMTDDGPVYLCCKGCAGKIEKDSAPYASKVAEQRKTLAATPRVQVTCPLSGKPIDKKAFTEVDGEKVYFCCSGCAGKYEKEPAKYQSKLQASYTYQTRCPVMGGPIDPAAFADTADGARIYFCCPGCDKKLFAAPAKYAPKLEAQGVRIEPSQLKPAKTAS